MVRTATPAAVTASQEIVVRPVTLVRIGLDSGDILATNAPFSIFWAWDGGSPTAEFLGVGNLGQISAIEEAVGTAASSVQLTLSGIPSSLISIALGEEYRGRDVRIWLALLDDQHALIDDPVLLWRGRLDTMNLALGGTATIEATAHSRLVDAERPRMRRYTNEDQQAVYPGDKGLEFVSQISAGKELIWGKS